MGNKLQGYMKPPTVRKTKKVIISEDFIDPETNKPLPFTIRTITQKEAKQIAKKATRTSNSRSGREEVFDRQYYRELIVLAGTVEPDFANSDLCNHYGVLDPIDCIGEMLSMGEFTKLENAIYDISQLDNLDAIEEEVKNS